MGWLKPPAPSPNRTAVLLAFEFTETTSANPSPFKSPEAIIQKFLQNMSQRAAEMLRDDMEARGPVRVTQVEAEQKSILQTVRRLADSGEIVINSGGEDYV